MLIRLPVVVVALVLSAGRAGAAFERGPAGARPTALAGAGLAFTRDLWGGLHNPASLRSLTALSCGVSYSPSLFEIPGLGLGCCAAGFPFGPGAVAVSIAGFGISGYRESTMAFHAGFDVGGGVALGVRIAVCTLAIQEYGTATIMNGDAGFALDLNADWSIGAVVAGPGFSRFGAGEESLPISIECGTAYRPLTGLVLGCSLFKDMLFPPELRLGLEYMPVDILWLRCGITDDPALVAAGIGLSVQPFHLDYAVCSHRELGFSHTVSLLYTW